MSDSTENVVSERFTARQQGEESSSDAHLDLASIASPLTTLETVQTNGAMIAPPNTGPSSASSKAPLRPFPSRSFPKKRPGEEWNSTDFYRKASVPSADILGSALPEGSVVVQMEASSKWDERWLRVKEAAQTAFRQQTVLMYVCIFILAVVSACVAILMDYATTFLQDTRTDFAASASSFGGGLLLFVLLSTFYACLAALCVRYISPNAAGSGIPEMKSILSGISLRKFLSVRTLLAKILGLVLAAGAGLPIGKEGPFVHVSSALCRLILMLPFFGSLSSNEYILTQLFASAAAAGVVANFGAAFGGVIFSIEVTATFYLVRNLGKAIFAACIGSTIFYLIRSVEKDHVTFLFSTKFAEYPYRRSELVFFCMIGVIGGLLGALFNAYVKRSIVLRKWMTSSKQVSESAQTNIGVISVMVWTILTATMYFALPFVHGTSQNGLLTRFFSSEDDEEGFPDGLGMKLLFQLFFAFFQFVLSGVAVTLPIPCGSFLPIFLVGACVGRMFGQIVKAMTGWSTVFPGAYSVVAAAACATGSTKTLSTAIIVLELTGELSLLLPVLIAVTIAYFVGYIFNPSIYDMIMDLRSLPYLKPFTTKSLSPITEAGEIMIPRESMIFLTPKTSIDDVRITLSNAEFHSTYPLVDPAGKVPFQLLGTVQRCHLEAMLEGWDLTHAGEPGAHDDHLQFLDFRPVSQASQHHVNATDLQVPFDSAPFILPLSTSLHRIYFVFTMIGVSHAFIVDCGTLKGVVTKRLLIQLQNRASTPNTEASRADHSDNAQPSTSV
eukprot:ANDGO_05103.mRNA.1 Chloride channel protein F